MYEVEGGRDRYEVGGGRDRYEGGKWQGQV